MKYSAPVMVRMTKKPKLIIGLAVSFLLIVIVGFVAVLIRTDTLQRNWNLGLGKQQSSTTIEEVKRAVDSVQHEAILETYVANANTTGNPFGHSIRINILLDDGLIKETDTAVITALGEDVTNAVKSAGIKDTYDLYMAVDDNNAVGLDTSSEYPATAKRLPGGNYVYDESFEVK